MEPDLRAVLCLNEFAELMTFVVDVRNMPVFRVATVWGEEEYRIKPSSMGPEGYVATCDTNKMPRRVKLVEHS